MLVGGDDFGQELDVECGVESADTAVEVVDVVENVGIVVEDSVVLVEVEACSDWLGDCTCPGLECMRNHLAVEVEVLRGDVEEEPGSSSSV